MRIALFGLTLGVIAVGFSPVLPSRVVLLGTLLSVAWLVLASSLRSNKALTRGCGRYGQCARTVRWVQGVLGLLLGLCLGVLHGYSVQQQQLSPHCVNVPLLVSGQVVSLPVIGKSPFGGQRARFQFSLTQPLPGGCDGPRYLQLSYYGEAEIQPGQVWQFSARLKQPRGLSNPGIFDAQYWFVERGIHAVGSVKGEGTLLTSSRARSQRHHQWRLGLRHRIDSLPLPETSRAVLAALTIADKSGIDDKLWQQFAALGINHLLVISGLHVGLVAGLGLLVGRVLASPLQGVHRVFSLTAPCCALLAAGSYMALAGFTLPTQRAFIMLLVFVVGTALARPQPAIVGLLYAATVIVLLNPLATLGSGFWLSFGAVLSLLWLANWQRGDRWLPRFAMTHGYMTLVMFPMGAFFFGGASVVSMLANAVLIPVIGLFVVPIALCAAIAHLLGFWGEWALWILAGEILAFLLAAIDAIAGGRTLLFQYSSGSTLAVCLAVVGCVVLVVPLHWRWRLPALLLPLWLLLPSGEVTRGDATETSITVLDVGQGTAVLVRAGHRVLLYDTGGGTPGGYTLGNAVVIPYLRSLGVTQLDTIIVSHQDADHSAGLPDVLRAFPVARLRYGGEPEPNSEASFQGKRCEAGESWRWPGGQVFSILSPAAEHGLSRNNGSCVLSISVAGKKLLFTGDIDGKRERILARYWTDRLASEALLVGHHGSKTSSYASFLKWAQPEIALVSAGYANRFGHPHADVTKRLQEAGAVLYNTAQNGAVTITVRADGEILTRVSRHPLRPYWM